MSTSFPRTRPDVGPWDWVRGAVGGFIGSVAFGLMMAFVASTSSRPRHSQHVRLRGHAGRPGHARRLGLPSVSRNRSRGPICGLRRTSVQCGVVRSADNRGRNPARRNIGSDHHARLRGTRNAAVAPGRWLPRGPIVPEHWAGHTHGHDWTHRVCGAIGHFLRPSPLRMSIPRTVTASPSTPGRVHPVNAGRASWTRGRNGCVRDSRQTPLRTLRRIFHPRLKPLDLPTKP